MADGYVVPFSNPQADQRLEKSLEDPFNFLHDGLISNTEERERPAPQYRQLSHSCTSSTAKLHVVMVPYPVQGQVNPMMQFAKSLTAARNDIVVTLVNNKHNHDCIQRTRAASTKCSSTLTSTCSRLDGTSNTTSVHNAAEPLTSCNLHLTWVDNGLPADFDYSEITGSNFARFHESTVFMKKPLKQLLQSLKKEGPPVLSVLFGTLCPWAQSAAVELGIPSFLFWTQSASVFSMYYHLPLLVTNGFFPYNKKSLQGCGEEYVEAADTVTYIPGLPALRPSSFPSLLHVDDISDPSLASVNEQFSLMGIGNCNGVIVNSFKELERATWQALQQELPYPILLVGPLLPSAFLDGSDLTDKTSGASLLQEKSDCIKWLDSKQKESVVYISFGSLFRPSAAELEGIASGIKASKQPYLWVIRPSPSFRDASDILPKGFVEETKDYGLIISWAPQVQVLSHPSVGAFLTHCGWNSTLESLSMGMPMIAYPIFVDQPTNSTYVCDIWKVGMALKRQDDGEVKSEDVERVLRTVFEEDEGSRMRERALKLRDAARQAVQVQGSSYADMQKFIQALQRVGKPTASAILVQDRAKDLFSPLTNQIHML